MARPCRTKNLHNRESLEEQSRSEAEAKSMKNFFSLVLAAGLALGVVSCQGAEADTVVDAQVQTVDFQLSGMT